MKREMDFTSLPFEIVVLIAEVSHEVWYLLSLTIREFGLYSISPSVMRAAQRHFGFRKYRTT